MRVGERWPRRGVEGHGEGSGGTEARQSERVVMTVAVGVEVSQAPAPKRIAVPRAMGGARRRVRCVIY